MEYFFHLLNHYGLWLGFIFVIIENIGIPFPIEFVYLYGQNLINSGNSSLLYMMTFFTLAHMTGAVISYYIGLAGNSLISDHFKHRPGLTRAKIQIEHWYNKYGMATNLITRLVGYIRPWSSLIAGFAKENFYSFFVWSLLGTLIFNLIAISFSGAILYFWRSYPLAQYIIVVGFIFFFAIVWLVFPWISRRIKL